MKNKFKSEDIYAEIEKMHDNIKQKQDSGEFKNELEFLYISDEFKEACIKHKDEIKGIMK